MHSSSHARALTSAPHPPLLLGRAPVFREILDRLPAVARAQRTTLITGPTGCGKDVVARVLHSLSERKGQPYVTVHCAALPENLVEAEMFGHCRGAFTGAMQTRGGLIRSAAGGTLFLDEIDSLPAGAQAKLLRFLETGEFRAVGTDRVEYSNAWVIAATNANLTERVRAGLFRADLMFRLAVVEIPMPPLRARPEDIPELALYFLEQVDATKSFSPEALQALAAYDWPGNVRELKHRVESAALLSSESTIRAVELRLAQTPTAENSEPAHPTLRATSTLPAVPYQQLEQMLWEMVNDGLNLAQAMRECERMILRAALRAESDNRTRAASRLGIHVRTIFKKLADA